MIGVLMSLQERSFFVVSLFGYILCGWRIRPHNLQYQNIVHRRGQLTIKIIIELPLQNK